mmetsp:Transcript_10536/g.24427  ORF Transcript_10536/g.24427 Transcript_10536/m.24427 type:complete len:142 (-) Transcript_10536:46-471(-)
MAKAVAKLVAVRKSTDATAQAAVEVHGRELRAAVAEAEGRTAAAVAEAVEFMRQSAFAAVEVMAAEFKRELLAVAEAATLKAQLDHEQQTANEMRIKMKDEVRSCTEFEAIGAAMHGLGSERRGLRAHISRFNSLASYSIL